MFCYELVHYYYFHDFLFCSCQKINLAKFAITVISPLHCLININVLFWIVLENAIKDDARVKQATGLCKQIVSVFSHCWKKKSALKKAQQELNVTEHSLITECPTRWGSRQKMIGRVLEQSKALSQVLSDDKKMCHLVTTWQDTDVLESINNAIGPFQEFTDALSGEAYVSVSYLKPVLHLLRTSTLAEHEEDRDLTK